MLWRNERGEPVGTKEKLLELLERSRGTYYSGAEIAKDLEVSRNAVWKAVKTLQAQGYPIDAVTNRGYCLAKDSDVLSAAAIEKALEGGPWQIRILETVPSTNSLVRELANSGAPEGTVVIAQAQTQGRGRMGRSFCSPRDTGLYLSLLLRPRDFSPDQALQLTTMAASALCLAIEETTGIQPGIKWVNDLFLNRKKICGILTEAGFNLETGHLDYVVVGLGLNLYPPRDGFPDGLQNVAGSLLEQPVPDLKNRISARFLSLFADYYQNHRFQEAAQVYRSRSILVGKTVSVAGKEATVLDITDRCQLLVAYPDGTEQALSYGEVTIVNL